MYAIIQTGGKQYWVTPGEKLTVEKLEAKKGDDVKISALWSASGATDGAAVEAGKLPKALVVARVLRHLQSPKILVFRKRPKKAYEKMRGHRQDLTELEIKEIQLS
ncbi:MAG: 50S ribosomal protein L21 [Elusimicrobiales bacterium]|nr:50S ribosomal protein L21 [Elusimicrobiales bacterium]